MRDDDKLQPDDYEDRPWCEEGMFEEEDPRFPWELFFILFAMMILIVALVQKLTGGP